MYLFIHSDSVTNMLFADITYDSQVHQIDLHSRHNRRRRTEEGYTVRYCICTHHLYKVHALAFDLKEEKHGDSQQKL